ncbi:MAG: UTP--glucose-1-phosphate uridylyltransferase GalU [Nitrospirota bacterium]
MTVKRDIIKAVFPAAGLGTRFLPATKASPKEMLPLVDKPMIQYVVEEAVAAGIKEIIIITGRHKRAIEDHFDLAFELEETLKKKGETELLDEIKRIANMVTICYIRQKEQRGLGHAILCARHLVDNGPFAVMLGDDVIDSSQPAIKQIIEIYKRFNASVIAIEKVDKKEVHRYGIIDAKPVGNGVYRIIDLVEKPKPKDAPSNLAIIGRYILTPEIFEMIEKTEPGKHREIQLTDALRMLARKRPIYACEFKGKRYDAGDKLGFLQATVELALKNKELGSAFRNYLKALRL